jgi:hypothetical protein
MILSYADVSDTHGDLFPENRTQGQLHFVACRQHLRQYSRTEGGQQLVHLSATMHDVNTDDAPASARMGQSPVREAFAVCTGAILDLKKEHA